MSMGDAEAAREAEHLVLAERHIVEGERRVTEQCLRVETLRADGHDTVEAEKLLRTLKATLVEFCDHRTLILQTKARLAAEKDATA